MNDSLKLDGLTSLTVLFGELVNGAPAGGGAFVLNSGDAGLLRSLDRLSAADASHAIAGGATVAAHAQHLRYGLSLMNRWAREGGDPFADATWDLAWQTTRVDEPAWAEIREGLRQQTTAWLEVLGTPRTVTPVEQSGLIGSIVHLGYHLGAIRQIAAAARGPRDGTFG